MLGVTSCYVISIDQSEASITFTWCVLIPNERMIFSSLFCQLLEECWPIRGQYSGQVIGIDFFHRLWDFGNFFSSILPHILPLVDCCWLLDFRLVDTSKICILLQLQLILPTTRTVVDFKNLHPFPISRLPRFFLFVLCMTSIDVFVVETTRSRQSKLNYCKNRCWSETVG